MSTLRTRFQRRVRAAVVALAVMSVACVGGTAAHASDVNSVTISVCDGAHLAAAFAALPAQSTTTIRFACDGDVPITPETTGGTLGVNNADTVTLDGAGHSVTLDGFNESSLFIVEPGSTFIVNNLTLQHGWSQDLQLDGGGAIWNNGTTIANNDTFSYNHAFNEGGAIWNRGRGTLTVNNSNFVGNTVSCYHTGQGGGAISQDSSNGTTINGSTFDRNSATGTGSGGAIFGHPTLYGLPFGSRTGPVSIAGSTFKGNSVNTTGFIDIAFSAEGGGAIDVFGQALTISHSSFLGNRSPLFGGAISFNGEDAAPPVPGGRALTITDSQFLNNSSLGFPGDSANLPGVGGAVDAGGANAVTITGTTFALNRASNAGAMLINGSSSLTLTNSRLMNNLATLPASQSQQVGGLLMSGASGTVTNTVFMSNQASNCGLYFGATLVDGHGNYEFPGKTCGFGA